MIKILLALALLAACTEESRGPLYVYPDDVSTDARADQSGDGQADAGADATR